MSSGKHVPQLRSIPSLERSTSLKARESWHILGIISEFVEATERLAEIRPAVSVFGSARIRPGHRWYELTVELSRQLSEAGFSVISGGGPGIMEAANRGAFEGPSPSVGLNIELPHEQLPNDHLDRSDWMLGNEFSLEQKKRELRYGQCTARRDFVGTGAEELAFERGDRFERVGAQRLLDGKDRNPRAMAEGDERGVRMRRRDAFAFRRRAAEGEASEARLDTVDHG